MTPTVARPAFTDILRESQDEELAIEADKSACTVRSANGHWEMPSEDPAHFPDCRDQLGKPIHCQPGRFPAEYDHLFRNDGGQYVDVSAEAGIIDRDGHCASVEKLKSQHKCSWEEFPPPVPSRCEPAASGPRAAAPAGRRRGREQERQRSAGADARRIARGR